MNGLIGSGLIMLTGGRIWSKSNIAYVYPVTYKACLSLFIMVLISGKFQLMCYEMAGVRNIVAQYTSIYVKVHDYGRRMKNGKSGNLEVANCFLLFLF